MSTARAAAGTAAPPLGLPTTPGSGDATAGRGPKIPVLPLNSDESENANITWPRFIRPVPSCAVQWAKPPLSGSRSRTLRYTSRTNAASSSEPYVSANSGDPANDADTASSDRPRSSRPCQNPKPPASGVRSKYREIQALDRTTVRTEGRQTDDSGAVLELSRVGERQHHTTPGDPSCGELAGPMSEATAVGVTVEHVAIHTPHERRIVERAIGGDELRRPGELFGDSDEAHAAVQTILPEGTTGAIRRPLEVGEIQPVDASIVRTRYRRRSRTHFHSGADRGEHPTQQRHQEHTSTTRHTGERRHPSREA